MMTQATVDLLVPISHAVSPVAVRACPICALAPELAARCRNSGLYFVRLPGIPTPPAMISCSTCQKSARREPVKRFLTVRLSPTPFRTTAV